MTRWEPGLASWSVNPVQKPVKGDHNQRRQKVNHRSGGYHWVRSKRFANNRGKAWTAAKAMAKTSTVQDKRFIGCIAALWW
jgi:hypothetical protein